jgi:hypothetical protein
MAFGDMGERMMMGCFWSGLGLMLSEGVYNTKAMLLSSISPACSVRAPGNFVCDVLKYFYLSCVGDLLPESSRCRFYIEKIRSKIRIWMFEDSRTTEFLIHLVLVTFHSDYFRSNTIIVYIG